MVWRWNGRNLEARLFLTVLKRKLNADFSEEERVKREIKNFEMEEKENKYIIWEERVIMAAVQLLIQG